MEQFYLVKLFIRKDSYLKLDDYEINTLLKLDNLKILEYVTYVDDSILQKKNIIFDILRINNLDIIKWYFSKRCIYMKYDLYKCFKIVCKRGNLEIIKYIYHKYNLYDYVKENLNIFNIACKSNNIHTIFWIYNILDKNTVLKLKDYEWEYIILSRNYQIIRWILETKNIVVNKKAGLKYSIQNGLFDIVKLLCDFLYYDDILKILHLYEGLNIRHLLLNCDLDIQFFRNYINVPILKKKVDYNLIEDICIKQDYEILDWIRQYFNIDSLLRHDNDKLFRKLCNMRKISIIRYMMSIFNFYSYKIENDIIIPLIKDSIEYFYENKELDNIVKYYNIKTEKK